MANSPTQRTLARLRKLGYRAEVVEKWLPYTRKRKDLFGCIDVIGIRPGEILGVQATSRTNQAVRLKKSLTEAAEELRGWLVAGGRFEVWGWRKCGPRGKRKLWQVTRTEVYLHTRYGPLVGSVLKEEST